MDQPVILSRYLRLLRRRWPLILIPTVVALGLAVIVGVRTPVAYRATATLIVPNQQLAWKWENKLSDIIDTRFDWRGEVMALVGTEDMAERALTKVQGQLERPLTVAMLRKATQTRRGPGSLIELSVTAATPHDAMLLANAMAAAIPEAMADYYDGNFQANQQALDAAMAEFRRWDDKLREFRSRTGIGLGLSGDLAAARGDALFGAHSTIKQELVIKNSDRAALQNAVDHLDRVLQALATQGEGASLALADVPELARYGVSYEELRQLAATDPAALRARLQTVRAQMSADLEVLTADAVARQGVEAQLSQEWEEILRQRGNWLESVTALEGRAIELQMKRIIEGDRVKLVDAATLPQRPARPNWPLYLGLAGTAGLLLGLLLAVIAVYWRGDGAAHAPG
jgi:capsular polysaccharide biosynthesis protein